jgi:hypothetical protein
MEKIYRVNKSRREWKDKAVARMGIISSFRKSRARYRKITAELRKERAELIRKVRELERELSESPKAPESGDGEAQPLSKERTRSLCVILILHSVISFRSVPRILQALLSFELLPHSSWIPHFTSIIHWTERLGLARLLSVCKSSTSRWIAVIDSSIDIGVQKALVVLRIELDALDRRGGALTLADAQCVGLRVGSAWNGKTVQAALGDIFERAGCPAAILKDGGTDLNCGVALWREAQPVGKKAWVCDDIGHVIANALKAEFSGLKAFDQFLQTISRGSSRIRQTVLAGLLPPRIRTKGRFQGISRVAKWAEKVLEIISGQGRAPEYSARTQLRRAFEGLSTQRPFIERFQLECRVASQVMELLKNQGLNQASCRSAKRLLEELPQRSILKQRVHHWLEKHLRIQTRLGMGQQGLAVSSDVIESLFGKFKTAIQRSPLGEMTAMALTIPALCGTVTAADVAAGLEQVSHNELRAWAKAHIPPSLQQLRRKTFDLRRGEWVPEIGKYG